ncbi:hypothetical protein RFI_04108, partial [Reticulomyxa filosa]
EPFADNTVGNYTRVEKLQCRKDSRDQRNYEFEVGVEIALVTGIFRGLIKRITLAPRHIIHNCFGDAIEIRQICFIQVNSSEINSNKPIRLVQNGYIYFHWNAPVKRKAFQFRIVPHSEADGMSTPTTADSNTVELCEYWRCGQQYLLSIQTTKILLEIKGTKLKQYKVANEHSYLKIKFAESNMVLYYAIEMHGPTKALIICDFKIPKHEKVSQLKLKGLDLKPLLEGRLLEGIGKDTIDDISMLQHQQAFHRIAIYKVFNENTKHTLVDSFVILRVGK